jgi:MoxR-like ATPase
MGLIDHLEKNGVTDEFGSKLLKAYYGPKAFPKAVMQSRVSESGKRVFSLSRLRELIDIDDRPKGKPPELTKESEAPIQAPSVPVPAINNVVGNYISNCISNCVSNYVPKVDPTYVPIGHWKTVKAIVESGDFFPAYIYGIPGIGKTTCVQQVCAKLKRPFFRIQVTKDMTEEDLIGSIRLKDGNTIWQDGGVISAYRTGGVVVLDEIDQNSYALMALQPVIEGKPYFIRATGELVHPAPGFQLFATANTKGDGTDYSYSTTMMLNSAFLDRFAITLRQEFPTPAEEKRIALKFIEKNKIEIDPELFERVLQWVTKTREHWKLSPDDSAFISTRRIGFIFKAWKITKNIKKALEMTLSKFSKECQDAALKLFDSMTPDQSESDFDPFEELLETENA